VKKVTMSEELAAFRDRMPGCSIVAFADLSTGMVLASDTAQKITQEKLDALCADAHAALIGAQRVSLARAFEPHSPQTPDVAVTATRAAKLCFVRAPAASEEALCIVLSPQVAVMPVIEAAKSLLQRTVAEGG
jgi:hypothetical protein